MSEQGVVGDVFLQNNDNNKQTTTTIIRNQPTKHTSKQKHPLIFKNLKERRAISKNHEDMGMKLLHKGNLAGQPWPHIPLIPALGAEADKSLSSRTSQCYRKTLS